jgi:PAS domain S-box-containing protein
LGKGGSFTTEFRIRRTNGVVIWLSISGVVEHAQTGKPLSAYGILQDITERKERIRVA